MQEFLNNIIPNVMAKLPDFYAAIGDTLLMVVWSGAISFVLGLALGVLLTVTKPGGILENKVVYQIVDKLVSLFRSIPFIILLTWVMPFSRVIMGTALYVRGAIVPLVFGAVPFFTRQVEGALAELDGGLIEAALSMGSTPLEIIFRVYLKESVAAIARGTTITAITCSTSLQWRALSAQAVWAISPSAMATTATWSTSPTSRCWSWSLSFALWSSLAARSSGRTRIKESLT